MVSVSCAFCGSAIEPYGDEASFQGPVPCVACHKSTWVSIDDGKLVESQKWPLS